MLRKNEENVLIWYGARDVEETVEKSVFLGLLCSILVGLVLMCLMFRQNQLEEAQILLKEQHSWMNRFQ